MSAPFAENLGHVVERATDGSWATFNREDTRRYDLGRVLASRPAVSGAGEVFCPTSRLLWVMLNPSTARASAADPTIKRCMSFTRREGYDELVVVNLFSLRSPSPAALRNSRVPVGPGNEDYVAHWLRVCDDVVVAWGGTQRDWAPRTAHILRFRELWNLHRGPDQHPLCLGVTKDGDPLHPMARGKMRVPDDRPFERFVLG